MHLSVGRKDSLIADGQGKSHLQHLLSCSGVSVGKTLPLLMGIRKVVCNIRNHALECGCVRLPSS